MSKKRPRHRRRHKPDDRPRPAPPRGPERADRAPRPAAPAAADGGEADAIPLGPEPRTGTVARWARRFRRLAAVVALPKGEPPWGALRALEQAKHGGIGIPRLGLDGASDSTRARFMDKPFLVLEHPDEGLARLARAAGPRAPAHIIDAAVHALSHSAPLVLVNERDASAVTPLVCHTIASPSPQIGGLIQRELDQLLRSGSAAVQDSYGQLEKPGEAIRDLASGRARERTLEGLLVRLTRARKTWAQKDAPRRFRRAVDAAQREAESQGRTKEEAQLASIGQPVALGYLDLLPLILTRLGPSGELARLFHRPLALLTLGIVPVLLVADPAEARGQRAPADEDSDF